MHIFIQIWYKVCLFKPLWNYFPWKAGLCVFLSTCGEGQFWHVRWGTHGQRWKIIHKLLLFMECHIPCLTRVFLNKLFLVDIFINISFFSIFRTIAANTTREAFNGEIRQRTGNTWRQEQWSLSFQDILNDLLQQELHYIITEQRTLCSKRNVCGNFYFRYNHWMHNKR